MSHKGIVLVLSVVLICTMVIGIPLCEATDVNTVTCTNVTLTIIEEDISINTSEATEIQAHIHNGNPIAVTVSISEKHGSPINVVTGSDIVSVASGSTVDVPCYICADSQTNLGKYDVTIVMSVMDGINPVSQAEMVIPVQVATQYGNDSAYNKFLGIFENNLGSPLNEPWFTSLVTLVIWILISFAVGKILFGVLEYYFAKGKVDASHLNGLTMYWLSICVLLQGICNTLVVAGAESSLVVTINNIIGIVYVPILTLVIWDIYRTFVSNALMKSEQKGLSLDTSLVPLFNLIGKLVLTVSCIAIILSILHVDTAAIIAAAGIAGLGISLGAKPMISQFMAGIVLMIVRPFKSGDIVKIGSSSTMVVSKVKILQTEFTGDGSKEHIFYSNNKVADSKITNLTYGSRVYRRSLNVQVPFDTDMGLAKKLMVEAAEQDVKVIIDGTVPKPSVKFLEYADRSMRNLRLDFYVADYDSGASTAGRIRESILKKFYENGIVIPMESYEFTVVEITGDVNES